MSRFLGLGASQTRRKLDPQMTAGDRKRTGLALVAYLHCQPRVTIFIAR